LLENPKEFGGGYMVKLTDSKVNLGAYARMFGKTVMAGDSS